MLLKTRLTAAKEIETAPQAEGRDLPEGFVRLRLAVGSLCGTDLHYYSDFANAGFVLNGPVTLGHEACARVVEGGSSGLAEGTLVALNPIMNCGTCPACERGEVNLCTAKKFPGSATTVPHWDGFFQGEILHPARCCRPVGDHVNPRHLTFAEPMACALHALNKGGVAVGQKVLITGCGPMGLLAIAAAAARGVHVTALDVRPEAVEAALRVGASEGLVASEVPDGALDRRFDVAVEASGAIPAFSQCLKAVRQKGRVAILSSIQPRAAEIPLHLIMVKEIEVVGSFQFNAEFEEAVQLVESGAVDFDALTACTYPLAELSDALGTMAAGKASGKILIIGAE
ncbi:zinc-binding dehydrogenase [Pseudoruegeria sp. SHC-113]|uniref:zinc-binding dehydrogenase n=1 Tax=Pseudoruegeria sp. SHC-113 TaxID=2855439 RepID=UPI0021BB77B8|nr:alcohol dehydrogenase catalytic domain-containing protein [Pseudoruegeria sp. SHC-113]MCT8161732.1 alcohol dehydrogenase catalytic domain-containing protein [Pseudoruegeria sp. SHC-113]